MLCLAASGSTASRPKTQIILPPVKEHDRDDVPEFAWYLHWKVPEPRLSWLKKADQWRSLVRAYLASTTFMDSQIGRVLDALEATGRRDNTIIVLWSDNAWHLGEKAITGKNSLWERSTRVPLIFAGPGTGRGTQCSQPAELLDIYPTLVDLCGLPAKKGLEGHSLAAAVEGPDRRRVPGRPSPATTRATTPCARSIGATSATPTAPRNSTTTAPTPTSGPTWSADAQFSATKQDLARWLPKSPAPPAPGSTYRVLVKYEGCWLWEGRPIVPSEKED